MGRKQGTGQKGNSMEAVCMSIIPAVGGLRQEKHCEFKSRLSYKVRPRPA